MKNLKLSYKSDEQCMQDIDDIISGKNKSRNAWIVRRFISARKLAGDTPEVIRMMLFREYKQKYGDLQSGRKTAEQIKKESIEEIKQATNAEI